MKTFIALSLLLTSLSSFAQFTDTTCRGEIGKNIHVAVEKSQFILTVYVAKVFPNENRHDQVIADINAKIMFRQNLDSNGPTVGYGNQAYGNTYVNPEVREKAELFYADEAQLKIPYGGDNFSAPRESILRLPNVMKGSIKVKCRVRGAG